MEYQRVESRGFDLALVMALSPTNPSSSSDLDSSLALKGNLIITVGYDEPRQKEGTDRVPAQPLLMVALIRRSKCAAFMHVCHFD